MSAKDLRQNPKMTRDSHPLVGGVCEYEGLSLA